MSLQEVAGACEGFSGADLSALLADAQLEAVHEVLARPGGADEVRLCAPVKVWMRSWSLCSCCPDLHVLKWRLAPPLPDPSDQVLMACTSTFSCMRS